MISFWALWCVPCKEEMKKMNPIYNKYKDQGFEYLAINQDNQKSIAKVKSYIMANDYDFTVLLDTDTKIFEAYGSSDLGIPYSLLINSDKEIVAKHLGYVTGDEVKIEEEIIEVLESKNDKKDQEDTDDQKDTDGKKDANDKEDTDDKINGTDN
jgi:thiol-disulfide isomerase/thioredoxin